MRLRLGAAAAALSLVLRSSELQADASPAPVVGIDLGNEYMKLTAIAPGHNLEVVLNSQSKRKTRSVVNFAGTVRQFGEAAFAQQSMQPNATLQYFATNLGRLDTDLESVQEYPNGFHSTWYPYTVKDDNNTRHTVRYGVDSNGKLLYNEDLVSHLLSHGKDLLQEHLKDMEYPEDTEVEAVLLIPADYSYRQRQLLRQSAQIAGYHPIGFLYEPVAAALSHALDIAPPPSAETNDTAASPLMEPIYKAFYSMGAKNSQICLIRYRYVPAPSSLKSGIGKQRETKEILSIETIGCSVTENSALGGHTVDVLLAEAAAKEFFAVNKRVKKTAPSARSWRRLLKEATKMKHTLSTNREASVFIEGFAEGKDLRVSITRDKLDALLTDSGYLKRLSDVQSALQSVWTDHRSTMEETKLPSNLNELIKDIELVGGGWRVPRVLSELEKTFSPAPIGMKCNADEAMAVGAAMMAANYSSTYKFKPLMLSVPLFEDLHVNLSFKDRAQAEGSITIDFPAGTLYGTQVKKILMSPISPIRVVVTDGEGQVLDVWTLEGADVIRKMEGAAMEAVGKKRMDYAEMLLDPEYSSDPEIKPEWHELPANVTLKPEMEVAVVIKLNHMGLISITKAAAAWQELAVEEKHIDKTTTTTTTTAAPSSAEGEEEEEEKDKTSTTSAPAASDTAPSSEDGEKGETSSTSTTTARPKRKSIFTESIQQRIKALTISPMPIKDDSKDLTEAEIAGLRKPYPLNPRQLREGKNGLKTYIKADREAEKLGEIRNRLETYIYDMRSKLRDSETALAKTNPTDVVEGLLKKLQEAEDWLYEEGFAANFNTVSKRYDGVKDALAEAVARAEEYSDRDRVIEGARTDVAEMRKKMENLKTGRTWLTEEHFRPVVEAVDQFEKWFDQAVEMMRKQSPDETPLVNRVVLKEKWVVVKEAFTTLQKVKKPKAAPTKSEL